MWTTLLSDGSVVQLRAGGATQPVLLRDVDAYCAAALAARMHEAGPAIAALVDGFASIIPLAALPLLTAKELEVMLCGTGDVDIELLKRNTEYDEEGSFVLCAVYLSFGPIGQSFTVSVTEACARRPGAAASVSRRRRTLLAGGGRRASRSHTLAASQAFERMHTLFVIGWKLGYTTVSVKAC